MRDCQDPNSDRFEAAFEALYTRYRDRVYGIAYRVTGSSTDAMDVMQESFALLFRKISGFRFDAKFSTWLFRIVVNCSIDHVRHERSRRVGRSRSLAMLDPGAEPADDPETGPQRQAETRELGDHVQECIQSLSPKLRAVLVLRYLEGLSYEELRETLGISMGTVKSRLARAHLAIERVLGGTLESFGVDAGAASAAGGEGVA